MNPFTLGLFAWQASVVFTMRSAQLWADPATASTALTGMALEKQKAFSDGVMAASKLAMTGAGAGAVAAAALKPAQTRVSANVRRLTGLPF